MNPAPYLDFDPSPIIKKAISLALNARYQTEPNPMVGAVLVDKTGAILSEGYHRKAGSAHAEVEALKHYEIVPKDAILFVTLEPCSFYGKTPPCTELILKKQVKTVVVGCRDPNPKVSGRGIALLREKGVAVLEGICESECFNLNRVFNKHIVQKIPYVTVKVAMSLDGKISMASGESQWITGEKSRQEGHRLRSQHQGIAVGAKTLDSDNPRLSDRVSNQPRQPHRIVFSSSGEIPLESNFVIQTDSERYLVAGNRIAPDTRRRLENLGINLLIADAERPMVRWSLEELYRKGICSLLVEGGGELIASFVKEKAIDQYYLFIAGKIIGERNAPAWCSDTGISQLADVPGIAFDRLEKFGEDILITGFSTQ